MFDIRDLKHIVQSIGVGKTCSYIDVSNICDLTECC